MKYTKPIVIAQSAKAGSYAAGCPTSSGHSNWQCRNCDKAQ